MHYPKGRNTYETSVTTWRHMPKNLYLSLFRSGKKKFKNPFTFTASFSSSWIPLDVHIMREFMSPNKLVFVAPEKILDFHYARVGLTLMAASAAL